MEKKKKVNSGSILKLTSEILKKLNKRETAQKGWWVETWN